MSARPNAAPDDLEPLSSDHFRDVIGRFASGVTVVTAVRDGVPLGTTASAFTSLSLEPPMVLVCMNRSSETGLAVRESGLFGVNILGESHPDLALRFAGKGANKFEGVAVETTETGLPMLAEALATLECRVTERTTGGTHLVFLAAVERAAAKPGNPLAYYRGQFGRFSRSDDEEAYRALRDLVVDRRIPIDAPVDLDAIARDMGVERSVVYYSLTRLANDGLVRRNAAGRFEVVGVTPALMEDAVRGRGAIEFAVAMQMAGNITQDDLAALDPLLEELERRQDSALPLWLEAFNAYLDAFVALAGSHALSDAYRRMNMMTIISSQSWATRSTAGPPEHAASTHRALLAALLEGDRDRAYQIISDRIEGTIRGLRVAIERAGGEV